MKASIDMNKKDDKGNFVLASLPYTDDYLEPYIGARTVRYHYWKHLRAYIDNVNSLKKNSRSIEQILRSEVLENYGSLLYENVSQVFNHYFYFEQLDPKGSRQMLDKTKQLVEKYYGSWDTLRSWVIDAGMSIFGSGWVFLTTDKEGKALWIRSFPGTGTPIIEVPLLALDVWEHAYYLDYQNDRKTYIERFFEAIDWSVIERRLLL